MSITALPAAEITPETCARWGELIRVGPAFHSPFFRPEFTQLVASVRTDVETGLLEERGELLGVFPFQRSRSTQGRPVGGPLSDFHGMIGGGVIGARGHSWNVLDLLRGCQLTTWSFHHLVADQTPFQDYCFRADASPYLDLEGGFPAYWQRLSPSARETIRKTRRMRRKIERQVGPVRVEVDVRDGALLDQLIRWKSQQYQRTGVRDVFAFPWIRALLHAILDARSAPFSGQLAALYVGDQVVALHMGMRSLGTLHYWFPAYHVDYARFAPGRMLLLAISEQAAAQGITRIDLGRGLTQFKRSAMTDIDLVYDGMVDIYPWRHAVRRRLERMKDKIQASSFRQPVRRAWRWLTGGPDRHLFA